jgi:hypothetical protein
LAKLSIIHVHGQLGEYPAVPYLSQKAVDKLKEGARGIRMIHDEDIKKSDGLERARRALKEAHDVIFLGFGYDKRSVRRLGLSNHVVNRTVFGTDYGLSTVHREDTEALSEDQRINLNGGNRNIGPVLRPLSRNWPFAILSG